MLVMSLAILMYLETLTGDLFTARFANCQFDKAHFLTLRGGKTLSSTKQC